MKKPIRISVVSYLNSKPFIYGLREANLAPYVIMEEDIPSVCAEKMISGKADIGLLPIAVIPNVGNAEIISDFCIGADGNVDSVLLLSQVPLEQINTVLLDYQSATSVKLARVLAQYFWKIAPAWKNTLRGYEKEITGNTAGIVIGDRALELRNHFPYCYDLSGEWKKMTGLPFVFACWVSRGKPDESFLRAFNLALKNGIDRIPEIVMYEQTGAIKGKELSNYLSHSIDYRLDDRKRASMELFLDKIKTIK